MPMWIPFRIGRFHVQFAGFGVDVWVVHLGRERDLRPRIDVVVFGREVDFKFENGIGVHPPTEEYDAVEGPEGCEGWYDVYAGGGVLFEVFVFDGYFVVAEGLFAVRFGSYW